MTDTWLIWSNEHRAWWKPNDNGYTVVTELAGRYSFEDALDRCANACMPAPWTANRGIGEPYEVMVPSPEQIAAREAANVKQQQASPA